MAVNEQLGPDPVILRDLVAACRYKPGWSVVLDDEDRGQGSSGLTLTITVVGVDSYDHDKPRGVRHLFIVPAASYNRQSWQRWLFERFRDVETHELCEFFTFRTVEEGRETYKDKIIVERPYAPNHGAGSDPYFVFEQGTVEGAQRKPGT